MLGTHSRRLSLLYKRWTQPLPRCYWCERPFSFMTQGVAHARRSFCFECYRHHVLCDDMTMAWRSR